VVALALPSSQRWLPDLGRVDRDAVVAEAIDRVCQQGAIWLQADLARDRHSRTQVIGRARGMHQPR
jgi:hypothetical protein